jgi:hypothetical protein
MSSISFPIIAALLLAVATTTDPIEKVVADLSANPFWGNGASPILDLPENALTDQLVAKTFKMHGFSEKVTEYKIVEVKQVHIDLPVPYTAVLVKSDRGKSVVLLRYEGPKVGWWSRIVNVD